MELIIIYGIAFVVGGIYLLFHFINELRKAERIKAQIASEYGQVPNWVLDERDYNSMKRYYEQKPLAGQNIDNITWSDLSMDTIFKRMKNTQSSIGDEYCYRFFRQQHNNDLDHFDKAVQAMQERSDERQQLQFAFHKIGRNTDNGLIDLITDPAKFPKIPLFFIILSSLLGVASIAWTGIDIDYGILAMLFSFCISIILFYITLKKINSAMETLGMFTRLIKAAKLIIKLDIPELRHETEILTKALLDFRSINSLVDFIVQTSAIGAAGNGGSIVTIINAYFGLYGFAYQALVRLFDRNKEQALDLYDVIGYIELCISTASYRVSVDYYCKPVFTEDTAIDFEKIVHPLLKQPVPNSCKISNKIMITGSNASGKSTFAKTLAVNAIMGQLFNTCLANKFVYKPCTVLTSMNIQDDITVGDSFYVAEVKSLKRLMDEASAPGYPMLFMDEIFKGTNVVERIAAASVILKRLAVDNCFICLATHDLELTKILGRHYENYHFKEVIDENDIIFDYKLRNGVTTGSNAIKMLAYCKYDETIVEQAQQYADRYKQTGEWGIFL